MCATTRDICAPRLYVRQKDNISSLLLERPCEKGRGRGVYKSRFLEIFCTRGPKPLARRVAYHKTTCPLCCNSACCFLSFRLIAAVTGFHHTHKPSRGCVCVLFVVTPCQKMVEIYFLVHHPSRTVMNAPNGDCAPGQRGASGLRVDWFLRRWVFRTRVTWVKIGRRHALR